MGIFKFLTSKAFFKHLAIAILVMVLLFWITIKAIDVYTNHGEAIGIPNLTGVEISQVDRMNPDGYFDFVVIDSVYDDHFDKGAIVLQDPAPGSKAKRGRKIYVTIVASQPEMIWMPDLVDLTLRQAVTELRASGLKLETLSFVRNFAKYAVLTQKFEGDTIIPGTEILKGSFIELVLGKGLNDEKLSVPFLIGKTETEAKNIITSSALNIGFLNFQDGRDKSHSRVYAQQPAGDRDDRVEYGAVVDLWLRSDLYFNFDSLMRVYESDTLGADTLINNILEPGK